MRFNKKHSKLGELCASAVNPAVLLWVRFNRARLWLIVFHFFAVTRQTLPPLSSAINREPSGATVTPTGRP